MRLGTNPSRVRATTALVGALALLHVVAPSARAQDAQRARPVFVDGQAQIVPAFADSSTWIREQLWVETEFDIDGDGKRDRVHVSRSEERRVGKEREVRGYVDR